MLDPLYVSVSDSETTATDDDVMCLDSGEEGTLNTRNDFAYMEEMKRTQRLCADVRKMCKKFERSLVVGMHWIMRGWRLKTPILETMYFHKKHTTANICYSLLNARTDSGVWSKSVEDRIPQSEGAMRSDKLVYLATKPSLDALVLMGDCGSDVSVGSEKDNLLDCNRYAYPCLNIAVQAAMKSPAIQKFLYKLYSKSSVKAEWETILDTWLMGQNDAAKEQRDDNSTAVLAWRNKHEGAHPKVLD